MWTKVKRVIRSGFISFWRNGYVSLASVLVMTVTLSVVAALIFVGAMLQSTLQGIKDKVDVNVYFLTTAPEDQIFSLENSIKAQPEVLNVTYTSREQALNNFRAKHATDQLTLQALDELNDNPLGASLNIKAKDPSQYESIAQFVETKAAAISPSSSIIDKINYSENKAAIDALNRIIDSANRIGLILMVFFILISILITFNTIRLAIYISREEIAVMRLVGASNMFIRGPFVTVGLMYGFVSAVITLVLLYPITFGFGPLTAKLGTGLNLFDYYIHHLWQISLVILGAGLILGAISSFLAVKKYLKI
ncbi:MAG TPA: permease-like cell division protein FtsX [Candidatus Paceibacterota bacterium]|nr:permease-like cell division protein FtsX [Candidatus Paceibacterota bacterium]